MTPDNPKPIRLLIADDEEDLVTFLAHRLRKRGLDVTMALSGAEAVSAAAELKFDVAVVDLKMPDLDGITVIEQLKSLQPFLEAIMLTGHGSHDSAWEAGRLQAFRYILKPYDFEELHDLILTAAEHRRRRMQREFEGKLNNLMTGTTSPRDLIEESEKLRSEYEQD
jgi:two-component system NtrC family response regulator/two-component system response regulator AtoC